MDSRRLIVPISVLLIPTLGSIQATWRVLGQREADHSPLSDDETLISPRSLRESSFTVVAPQANILWHVDPFLGDARNTRTQQQKRYCKKCSMRSAPCPLLGNGSLNTSPPQRIRRQQSDNFRCYETRCKYNRGRGVLYVVRIYSLLGNGCFLCVRLETI
jgi:hypothetical protein